MTLTSLPFHASVRRSRFWRTAFFALTLCGLGAGSPIVRAELLVLNSAGSSSTVWRCDPITGARLGEFGYMNEGFFSMTVTDQQEVLVAADILGSDYIYRFNRSGTYLGTLITSQNGGYSGMCRGPDGYVYCTIANPTDHRNRIFRLERPGPTLWIDSGVGGMTAPGTMLFGADGDLYVADSALGVMRFNGATGAFRDVFIPLGRGGLPGVRRMIFGPDGRLYVTSTDHAVYRFEGNTGAFVDVFVAPGSGGLNGPRGLAFAPDGNLCVCSTNTGQVLRYSGSNGAFLGVLVYDPGLRAPVDLAFITPAAPETVWVEDGLPAGAVPGGNNDTWNWVPTPVYSGAQAHRTPTGAGLREHFFTSATDQMTVAPGDTLFAYAQLENVSSVMLSWCDETGWEHRAYWGANLFSYGQDGTSGRRYMGELSHSSDWVRLELPARIVGLEGHKVHGMSFSAYGGAVTWDRVGKISSAAGGSDVTPPTVVLSSPANGATVSGTVNIAFNVTDAGSVPTVEVRVDSAVNFHSTMSGAGSSTWDTSQNANGTHTITVVATDAAGNRGTATASVTLNNPVAPSADTVWFDEALPAGASAGASANDSWQWVSANPAPYSGTLAHQSSLASGIHEHYFNFAASLPLAVGDNIFTYVFIDPANPPQEIMLSFNDGASWEHRAYWGKDLIAYGSYSSEGRRMIRDTMPAGGSWVRLEVPARLVGLEGRSIQGMAFTVYDGRVTWDRTGKAPGAYRADTQPPNLTVTTPAEGGTVSGTINFSATATDDTGVAGAIFSLDGIQLANIAGPGPYSVPWNSTTVSNGSHYLYVQVRDTANNASAAQITFNVNNTSTADTAPPTVLFYISGTATRTVALSAEARDNVGVTTMQFLLDGALLGAGAGGPPTYSYSWNTATTTNGDHRIAAVATDAAGNRTVVERVVTVFNDAIPPAVTINSPNNGNVVAGTVNIAATANDTGGGVISVTFQIDGTTLATDYSAPFSASWNTTAYSAGAHTITAIAHDSTGNEGTNSVSVSVNNATGSTETIWFDDAIPNGANSGGSGGDGWNWITANPTPASGIRAHQSNLASGLHEHFFDWAYFGMMAIAPGDTLFAWVYLDPVNPPREIMLSWRADNWEHRAYWGANLIEYGTNGTTSRLRVGDIPAAGGWVKLTVPAGAIGLGTTGLYGMSFSLFDGRATWDATGKIANTTTDSTPPVVTITGPATGATVSGNVTLAASATDNVGVGNVQFNLDGTGIAWLYNAPFSSTWNSATVANGTHQLTAVATDAAGNKSTAAITITVNNGTTTTTDTTAPAVAITAPTNNATVSGTTVVLSAGASDNVGVASVTFRVDGTMVATDTTAPYSVNWNSTTVVNGSHAVTAVATDAAGNSTTSATAIISVNNSSSNGAVIWMDSAVPAGSMTGSSGGDAWTWVTANPAPFAGTRVHQSAIATGVHDHFFVGATSGLQVFTGDTIFVYVYLDPANLPSEVMLSFYDADGSWEHRAYWGANTITYGTTGTDSRRSIGALPVAGQWVRLEVPARLVGLEGKSVTGVSFTLVGGRATWDILGKVSP
jgi:hypothetical protein